MSKLEESLSKTLGESGVYTQSHQRLYFNTKIPWSNKDYVVPDIFIPHTNLYIEVKGFMTIEAMTKLVWIAKNSPYPYYIFQGTEIDWLNSDCGYATAGTKKKRMADNFDYQVNEILRVINEYSELEYFSLNWLSIRRVEEFIEAKIREYENITSLPFPL